MHNLLWAPIAVTAGRELATSSLPHTPVVADKPRRPRADRLAATAWPLPAPRRAAATPPLAEHRGAV